MNADGTRGILVALAVAAGLVVAPFGAVAPAAAATTLVVDADGTADFASIGAAVDAASDGDVVEVRRGEYDERVVVDSAVSLVATGDVVLDGGDRTGTAINVTAPDVVVDGFEIRRYGTGIRVGANNATVRDVRVRLVDGDAVRAASVDGVTVRDLTAEGNDAGVRVVDAGSVTVAGARIEDGTDAGVRTTGTATVTVRDATIRGNGDPDDDAFNEDEAPSGIDATNAEAVTVENVTLRGNEGNSLEVRGGDVFGRSVTVRDLTVRQEQSDAGTAVLVRGTPDPDSVTVDGAFLSGATGGGLDVEAETVRLRNVTAEDNADAGALVRDADGVDVTVRDGRFVDNRDADDDAFNNDRAPDGVRLRNAETATLENVTLLNNEGSSVEVLGGEVLGRTVTLRDVTARHAKSNAAAAIRVRGTPDPDEVTLANVTAAGAGPGGLRVRAERVTVRNATVEGSRDAGAVVRSADGVDVTVRDSRFVDNRDADDDDFTNDPAPTALEVENGERVLVADATFRNNERHALALTGTDVADRTVTVRNVTVRQTESDEGAALFLNGTAGVDAATVADTFVAGSSGAGVYSDAENVTVRNVTATDTGGDGLRVAGSDAVSVTDGRFTGHDGDGVDVEAGAATVRNATTSDNAAAGVRLRVGDGPTRVRGVTSENNARGVRFERVEGDAAVLFGAFEGNAVHAVESRGGATVDARYNWWGDPAGPDDDDCAGNVTCTRPLSSPPPLVVAAENVTSSPDATTTVPVTLEAVPTGLRSARFTVAVGNASVARLVEVSGGAVEGDGFRVVERTNRTATVELVDLDDAVASGDGPVTLARLRLRVEAAGRTTLVVSDATLTDEAGSGLALRGEARTVEATDLFAGGVPGVSGRPPTNVDDDPQLEDVDGDGERTLDDAFALAFEVVPRSESLSDAEVAALDFDGDGSLGLGDVFALAFGG
jgi:hypothetical protein